MIYFFVKIIEDGDLQCSGLGKIKEEGGKKGGEEKCVKRRKRNMSN